jgi:hypothetical protein
MSATLVVLSSCSLDGRSYTITGSQHYRDEQALYREKIRFTIKHGRSIVVAECDVGDQFNHCGALEVGRRYQFERGRELDFLMTEKPVHAVLSVESESLR